MIELPRAWFELSDGRKEADASLASIPPVCSAPIHRGDLDARAGDRMNAVTTNGS